jgi:hypothetical protein
MLFREIIAVYCENHTEHMNILCKQNTEFFNAKPGGPYSGRCALKDIQNLVFWDVASSSLVDGKISEEPTEYGARSFVRNLVSTYQTTRGHIRGYRNLSIQSRIITQPCLLRDVSDKITCNPCALLIVWFSVRDVSYYQNALRCISTEMKTWQQCYILLPVLGIVTPLTDGIRPR